MDLHILLVLMKLLSYSPTESQADSRTIQVVTLTAYSPEVSQTDSTPFITAFNTAVRECTVAVSRDLEKQGFTKGKLVWIPSINFCRGLFTVNDRMHKRKRKQLDIFLFNTSKAIDFGRRLGGNRNTA